jgi:hypothetical protein
MAPIVASAVDWSNQGWSIRVREISRKPVGSRELCPRHFLQSGFLPGLAAGEVVVVPVLHEHGDRARDETRMRVVVLRAVCPSLSRYADSPT